MMDGCWIVTLACCDNTFLLTIKPANMPLPMYIHRSPQFYIFLEKLFIFNMTEMCGSIDCYNAAIVVVQKTTFFCCQLCGSIGPLIVWPRINPTSSSIKVLGELIGAARCKSWVWWELIGGARLRSKRLRRSCTTLILGSSDDDVFYILDLTFYC